MKGNEDLIQGFDGRALILHGDVDHVVGGRTLLNMLLYLALLLLFTPHREMATQAVGA